MFEKTEIRRKRTEVPVIITLASGRTIEGALFVAGGERISDLLNDTRQFVPIETHAGVEVVAKGQIAAVVPAHADDAESSGTGTPKTDPYTLLRVDPSASDEELRAAWMKRLKASHPDRLASLDLDKEIIAAARVVSARINAAYDEVMAERKLRASAA
ncbi:glutamyl-tRNA synthetase [Parvularcula bermudensis HTCC2503]|uniref:Glutamyl-tRNA synthetase n=1 Tax=Parvularcula bermudensis (strain ATCC BAA-594 / HTCC2503 / KCTC 12087) TaxID=314260 RepID=E0TD54_PARBH|nr:J domain-containing protein [Parvularcula bermudensis]ADM08713.1 glutamyl-tRNA synthetase [Parvularcula bermudensis HTCC2503]